jgi:hypothetical protein
MADLYHDFGSGLPLSSTGGLLTSDGSLLTKQKLVRRFMTNPGGDPYNPSYGAGARQMIGSPISADRIEAIFTEQMRDETAVDQTTAPSIAVTYDPVGAVATVIIKYVDANTQSGVTITLGQ